MRAPRSSANAVVALIVLPRPVAVTAAPGVPDTRIEPSLATVNQPEMERLRLSAVV